MSFGLHRGFVFPVLFQRNDLKGVMWYNENTAAEIIIFYCFHATFHRFYAVGS